MTSVEIVEYVDAVDRALADLPDGIRVELLEDLPAHFAEVLAEGDGTLLSRLGDPAEYAAELRAAAGMAPAGDSARPGPAVSWLHRASTVAHKADLRLGSALGYVRGREFLTALSPGWWVLRGWIAAQLIAGASGGSHWRGLIPDAGGSRFIGLLLALGCITASVWIGRTMSQRNGWRVRISALVSLAIALFGIAILSNTDGSVLSYQNVDNTVGYNPLSGVNDLYVYDKDGKPVDGARLYDQSGNPIQLPQTVCQRSLPRMDADRNLVFAYPICAQDPGPFAGGPGPLNASPSGAPSRSVAPPTTPSTKPSPSHSKTR
jgi:hypothetical protein